MENVSFRKYLLGHKIIDICMCFLDLTEFVVKQKKSQ